jgi:hypothetical protein
VVVVSLPWLLFGRALAVASLRLRSRESKEPEIVVLCHELGVLRRQIPRPRLDERDRVFACRGQSTSAGRDENPRWGHRRLVGELTGVAVGVSGNDGRQDPPTGRDAIAPSEGNPREQVALTGLF